MSILENYYTRITPELSLQYSLGESLLFIGSCFADNVGGYLETRFLPVIRNPFGPAYNPLSIAKVLHPEYLSDPKPPREIFPAPNGFGSFENHTSLNQESPEALNKLLCQKKENLYKSLEEVRILTLTLGTAYCFTIEGNTVLNCQKQPMSRFKRILASTETMHRSLEEVLTYWEQRNPQMQIVLTVSPIRYLGKNPQENSLSKGRLHEVIHQLIESNPNRQYFPSYELLLDQLRDYRWYNRDLTHPSTEAIEIISEEFINTIHGPEWNQYNREARKMHNLVSHRIENPRDNQSKVFLEKRQKKIEDFRKRYPFACL